MRTLPLVAASLLFAAITPDSVAAQSFGSIPFAPGVSVTASQRDKIDSLVLAYAAEARRLQGAIPGGRLSPDSRRLLRERYRSAIASVLSPEQRRVYLEWAATAEAAAAAGRPQRNP